MILVVDVCYRGDGATVAGVSFDALEDACPTMEYLSDVSEVAEYAPGLFYKRELPCLMHLLQEHELKPDLILIDGYVFLDGVAIPGLGKYLYDMLESQVPVIGIAKTSFDGIGPDFHILRGNSSRPLYITCAGMDLDLAKANIASMHGQHRIPTLLKRVDQICKKQMPVILRKSAQTS